VLVASSCLLCSAPRFSDISAPYMALNSAQCFSVDLIKQNGTSNICECVHECDCVRVRVLVRLKYESAHSKISKVSKCIVPRSSLKFHYKRANLATRSIHSNDGKRARLIGRPSFYFKFIQASLCLKATRSHSIFNCSK
jgi:hypothetical protein